MLFGTRYCQAYCAVVYANTDNVIDSVRATGGADSCEPQGTDMDYIRISNNLVYLFAIDGFGNTVTFSCHMVISLQKIQLKYFLTKLFSNDFKKGSQPVCIFFEISVPRTG